MNPKTKPQTKTNDPVFWYNLIAPLYDISTWRVYPKYRRAAAEKLHLQPGLTVLDVACGTGQNFPFLLEGIGTTGNLIGTDYSAGMLGQAWHRVQRYGWRNVRLVWADARTLPFGPAVPESEGPPIHRVLCTLGLSVVPDWEAVFDRTFAMLAPGGRYAIMDWHEPGARLETRVVNAIARSEIQRRTWTRLQERSADFSIDWYFGHRIFVAAGVKPVHP